MKTSEQWLEENLLEYKENPEETLEGMLVITNIVIEQYFKNPSRATKDVLEELLKHNKLFIEKI